jgi:hypothetical protein
VSIDFPSPNPFFDDAFNSLPFQTMPGPLKFENHFPLSNNIHLFTVNIIRLPIGPIHPPGFPICSVIIRFSTL